MKLTGKKHKLISAIDALEIKKGIVVGLSGGPDSVCLLHLLTQKIGKEKLIAVHINHGLRAAESDSEQTYCEILCKTIGVEIIVFNIDVSKLSKKYKIGLEECGRIERYRLFEEVRLKKGFDYIAVAHNKNDQAETILMNIARGSGLDGLKGMEFQREKIIRPLLSVTRAEIEAYCFSNDLKPRMDSSNLSQDYTRNRVRLEIIPALNDVFDRDVSEQIVLLGKIATEDSGYIDKIAYTVYIDVCKEKKNETVITRSKLIVLEKPIATRIVRKAVENVAGLKDFTHKHFADILKLAKSGASGKAINLPSEVEAFYAYDILTIRKKKTNAKKTAPIPVELIIPGHTGFERIIITTELIKRQDADFLNGKTKENEIFVDFDKINEKLFVRNRQNGDIIYPVHSIGSKKLKDYLIDKKIPRGERDELVLIANGHEIVWVLGDVMNKKFKAENDSELILKITFGGK